MRPQRFDLIAFDWDGTLFDSTGLIARCIQRAAVDIGLPEPEFERAKYVIGLGLRDALEHVVPGLAPERYGDLGYAENTLYDGVPEALAALVAGGATLGLCTSKRVDFAERILRLFGLRGHFSLLSGGAIGLPKWRQLGALRAAGQVPDGALMIGDRAVDLIAAHRNGLGGGAVTWGHGSRQELEAEQPTHWFERPADWLRLLG